ncbi:MAG: DNA replication and repair protein RecF [Acidimicrobiia bacterium]|nr:DNA replication and repair protein RecF [Acidimicrobiia bacterium]MYC46294.1 DNA replication and repair protein RecF [Acidimicrobiia bacterium]MYI18550.1 DNA replication and repair protein RecF [Acidimicrobiia bacterium]
MLRWLEVNDFRLHKSVAFQPADGLTVVRGPNGSGKTSLLEAVGYLGTLSSFRGAGTADLVRAGASQAVLRGEFEMAGRRLLVETELRPAAGRNRTQVNRQPLRRTAELQEQVPVLTFQPDDLLVVKGSPGARRDAIDGAIVSLRPRTAEDRRRLAACLRQRNALLRQLGPGHRIDADGRRSLDIWDDRLAVAGETWAEHRRGAVRELQPRMERFFRELSGDRVSVVEMSYEPFWLAAGLQAALTEARGEDLRRAATTVGPHRDDLHWRLDGLPARTHASQGNQRCLSLALRLALHETMTEAAGAPPLLLLDDVFSELDPRRQGRLLALLPAGQILLATAGEVPPAARPAQVLWVEELPAAPTAPG